MYTKHVEYDDFNGVHRSEDHMFNLTEAELTEMSLSVDGGLESMLKRIIQAQSGPEIIKVFKDLVLKSYGVKSPDGRRFMKHDENGQPLSRAFSETEAYSIIFMELGTNDEAAIEFIKGILPKSLNTIEMEKAFNDVKAGTIPTGVSNVTPIN